MQKDSDTHTTNSESHNVIWPSLPDLCRRYNTTYSLPGASSCECLCSVSMCFSVLWRGSTLCCVLERRKKLFVAMPAFDTARFLATFLRHLARVPLSFPFPAFVFPKRCPICCFAMEVLLSFIHSISIPHSQSLARGKCLLHSGSMAAWQSMLTPS